MVLVVPGTLLVVVPPGTLLVVVVPAGLVVVVATAVLVVEPGGAVVDDDVGVTVVVVEAAAHRQSTHAAPLSHGMASGSQPSFPAGSTSPSPHSERAASNARRGAPFRLTVPVIRRHPDSTSAASRTACTAPAARPPRRQPGALDASPHGVAAARDRDRARGALGDDVHGVEPERDVGPHERRDSGREQEAVAGARLRLRLPRVGDAGDEQEQDGTREDDAGRQPPSRRPRQTRAHDEEESHSSRAGVQRAGP